jgi:uncharacterized protein YciI
MPARAAVHAVLALLAVLCALSGACAATGGRPAEREFTLVLLKTGPQSGVLSPEETKELFAGHFSNMTRLAEERQLLLAGPFGQVRHDETLRGLFVLDTSDLARAKAIAETDPTTQAGVFVLEYHTLSTDAPLRAFLDRVLDIEARAKDEGRERSPGEGARGYVLLTAEDGERALSLLEPLATRRDWPVLLLGRLDGTRAFAIIDATDTDGAHVALGDVAARLGPFVLDCWFATAELEQLPEMAR